MGFSGDVGPSFVFIDILINVGRGVWVVLGTAGRGVSWGRIAAFSTVVLRAVSLKVSGLFTGETGCVSHVTRVDGGGGIVRFWLSNNLQTSAHLVISLTHQGQYYQYFYYAYSYVYQALTNQSWHYSLAISNISNTLLYK